MGVGVGGNKTDAPPDPKSQVPSARAHVHHELAPFLALKLSVAEKKAPHDRRCTFARALYVSIPQRQSSQKLFPHIVSLVQEQIPPVHACSVSVSQGWDCLNVGSFCVSC